jgi:phosphoribosylamine-glycine ligase
LVGQVVCCPGNGGTALEGGKISNAEGVNGKQDNDTVIALVKKLDAQMVVVGPEAPLVDGLVDELAKACPNVQVFGPTKAAAELEASKVRSARIVVVGPVQP